MERYFHLHLISDSTGETLRAASRAVASQYPQAQALEHVYPMVRNRPRLEEVLAAVDEKPGIVLFTIADQAMAAWLLARCTAMQIPCVNVLDPIMQTFQSYLGIPGEQKTGAQHELNSEYFSRIDALNFSLLHDDGLLPDDVETADVILLGISRTSKTPTAIYLANRGIRTANVPLVPNVRLPPALMDARKPLVVALVATTDRIQEVRKNRVLGMPGDSRTNDYISRTTIAEELAETRKLCQRQHWPMIDVSRKSIEETAAAIIALLQKHRATLAAGAEKANAHQTGKTGP
jgi:regulator of PEP synthase PpsR (kinase-PPPase family)